MRRYMIYCLMCSGIMLSDAACEALYQAVCRCVLKEKHETKVYSDDVVCTSFNYSCMGSVSGIVFRGEIETDAGTSKVIRSRRGYGI